MGYSSKIKIDHKRPRKDGTAALFMQVIIDRKKTRIDLDIAWPPKSFSEVHLCRARTRQDPDVEEYNVIIGNARTKANSIHKDYLMRGIHLSLESFIREYRSNLNKNDFIQYFAQKSYERWSKQKIGDDTYEKEKGTVTKLKSFAPILPFHEFQIDWAQEFDNHLKRKFANEHNTRWMRHKHVITYLNIARKIDKINFTNPYERFKNKLVEGSWGPLELSQMKKLLEMYLEWRLKPLPLLTRKNGVKQLDEREGFTRAEIIVVRRFLFACNCALRISDQLELFKDMFVDGEMSLTPEKTEKYGTKITEVPLNDVAKLMLEDEIIDNPGPKVFNRYKEQSSNRLLKRIARKAKLKINLHHHVARYTFGSLMDQAGGNHTALMKYMGLTKRETLEKYVKTNKKVITADIEKMNEMIKG